MLFEQFPASHQRYYECYNGDKDTDLVFILQEVQQIKGLNMYENLNINKSKKFLSAVT